MKHFRATIKEANGRTLHPEYIGNVDERYLREFWGLDNPDVVEWKIEEIQE